MATERLYRAKIFTPLSDAQFRCIDDGGLVVDAAGTVVAVGPYRDVAGSHPEAELVDCSGRWITPGFVDTHVHVAQLPVTASYGEELLAWLERYIYPAERDFTPEAADAICPVFYRVLLSYGVTTAAVYGNVRADSTDVCFEWAERTGVRAIIGKVMMDSHSPDFLLEDTTESLRASEALCKKWHGADGGRLLYAFTPRFALACSRALMEGAGHLAAQYGAYVQTHLSENLGELARVRELFPEVTSYTDVYARAGLLGRKSIFAHGIHLDHEERTALKETDSALAHCPTSNLFLRSGLMPLRELMDLGLRIGLGSDVGAGPTLSPFESMRNAISVHGIRQTLGTTQGQPVTPATAFFLATLGGAQALSLGDRIGILAPGKEADFVVIDPNRLGPAPPERDASPDALLSRLVFLADDRSIERTYVRGELRYPVPPAPQGRRQGGG